jgi:hypothetical protein
VQAIAPQIFELLDDTNEQSQNSAKQIIAYMYRRHSTLVTRHLLEHMRSPLLPSTDDVSRTIDVISTDASIRTALRRLENVVSQPIPVFAYPLLRPLLLNLYLLSAYIRPTPHMVMKETIAALFEVYLKVTPSPSADIHYLVDRILYSSSLDGWLWSSGDEGGVSIRRITADDETSVLSLEEIQARVELIVEIVHTAPDDVLSEVLVGIMRQWLSPVEDSPMQYRLSVTVLI